MYATVLFYHFFGTLFVEFIFQTILHIIIPLNHALNDRENYYNAYFYTHGLNICIYGVCGLNKPNYI